jgi:tetratricopeptide (TPR) repeat protein
LIDPASAQPLDNFADGLRQAVWEIVVKPGQPPEKYTQALELARRSVAASMNPYNLSALGAARFRTGDLQGALEALAHSEASDYIDQENLAANLMFSAMANKKLGRDAEAKALLKKVIAIKDGDDGLDNVETPIFYEAAALIDPAATQPADQSTDASANDTSTDQSQPAPSSSQPTLPSDFKTLGQLAIYEFKIGHTQAAREVLRQALKAKSNLSQFTSDDAQFLSSAQALIDPPSTQPTDWFASGLSNAAWAIVGKPGQPPQKYTEALILAQQAVAAQSNADNLNTLGVAQFRTGDYTAALSTLAHSGAIDSVSQDDRVSNLAFSAMAFEKLGRKPEARATLVKLLEIAKEPNALDNEDDTMALNEAAAMIDPASTQPTTQPTTTP